MIGTIFDVKRFAIHDGQGLRTTLFLKGCPLHCPWCQNPEGIDAQRTIWHRATKCVGCKSCISACPKNAIGFHGKVHIDYTQCNACGGCADICPAGAMELVGQTISAEEAAKLLLRDRIFYGQDGGMTLSGGEVLLQWQFALEVLSICHDAGVDTAIETSLFASRSVLERLLDVVDHFIVDIKILDEQKHFNTIGVSNLPILENYQFLVEKGVDLLVRTPLIPGYTASSENIRAIAEFVYRIDPCAKYELLNYNLLCQSKYEVLNQPFHVAGKALTHEEIEQLYRIVQQTGLRIYKE